MLLTNYLLIQLVIWDLLARYYSYVIVLLLLNITVDITCMYGCCFILQTNFQNITEISFLPSSF